MSKTILYLENIINNRTNIIKTYILLDYLLSHGFRINTDTFFKDIRTIQLTDSYDSILINSTIVFSDKNQLTKMEYIEITYHYYHGEKIKFKFNNFT